MYSKIIPLTGLAGPQGCENLRFPNFVDSFCADGGEDVCFMHLPLFTLRKIPGSHFYQRLSQPEAIVQLEGLGQLKNSDYIRN
jgi:hypothetical protein